jgi:hypothetical protein
MKLIKFILIYFCSIIAVVAGGRYAMNIHQIIWSAVSFSLSLPPFLSLLVFGSQFAPFFLFFFNVSARALINPGFAAVWNTLEC